MNGTRSRNYFTAVLETANRQLIDLTGQLRGRVRKFDQSVKLFETSMARDPNAVNSRLSPVATLHYAGRVTEELPHIRWLLKVFPSESLLLHYTVQAANWNGGQAFVKDGIKLRETHDPRQLLAAKNILERGPSEPPRGSFQSSSSVSGNQRWIRKLERIR